MQTTVPTIHDNSGFDKYLSSFLDKSDKLALLLDYDGTLSPLVSHPDFSVMEPASEKSLYKLAAHPNVFLAIISGRGAQDVKNKVPLDNITYAGNHGLEIYFSNGTIYHHAVSDHLKQNFTKLVNALEETLAHNGAWVENKNASLTLHYRDIPEGEKPQFKEEATKIIESFGYIANAAHCAIEAKPPVQWNKGEAAKLILREEFGENWHTQVKVIFAGDDTTDEDAMKALKGKGISFRVSNSIDIQTYADYRLSSTKTISMLLKWIENRLFVVE